MQNGERQRQPQPNSPLRSGLGALLKHDDAARSKDEHSERDVTQTDSWSMSSGVTMVMVIMKSRPGQASTATSLYTVSNQDRGGNYLRNVHDHGGATTRLGATAGLFSI